MLAGEDDVGPAYLRSTVRDQDVSDAYSLTLRASGYRSEAAARVAGFRWRGVLERAFAYARAGADFGDRREGGLRFASHVQRAMEEEAGSPVLPHRYGLMVFPTHPDPQFLQFSAHGIAHPVRGRLVAALKSEAAFLPVSDSEHLAYTLYGSAFFIDVSPEARFMMLMMAVEALMEQAPRSQAARVKLDAIVSEVQKSDDLDLEERKALVDALQLQKRESLSQAGRRLAASLNGRMYADKPPSDFFTQCYRVRGKLAHPRGAGVRREDIESLIGPLQDFVGDLLAGTALLDDLSKRP